MEMANPDQLQFQIYQELGECYLEMARFAQAEAHFRAARRLAPEAPEPLLGLGETAFRQGNFPRARRYFSRCVRLFPEDDRAWCGLGRASADPEARWACLDRALSLNPRNKTALLELSRGEDSPVWPSKLEEHLRRYLSWHPGDLEIWLALGRFLARQGRNPEALEALEKVLLFQPQHPEAKELMQKINCSSG